MKFKVKDLLHENTIMSHVFLESISGEKLKEWGEYYQKKFEGIEDPEIEIKLSIEGFDFDPDRFFNHVFNHREKQVEERALALSISKQPLVTKCEPEVLEKLEWEVSDIQSQFANIQESVKHFQERYTELMKDKLFK